MDDGHHEREWQAEKYGIDDDQQQTSFKDFHSLIFMTFVQRKTHIKCLTLHVMT
jgi:hypothetical protein